MIDILLGSLSWVAWNWDKKNASFDDMNILIYSSSLLLVCIVFSYVAVYQLNYKILSIFFLHIINIVVNTIYFEQFPNECFLIYIFIFFIQCQKICSTEVLAVYIVFVAFFFIVKGPCIRDLQVFFWVTYITRIFDFTINKIF